MTIKAVIFDMDGVLIEAKDWHYEALNMALGLFGYEISRYEHLASYDGLPTSAKLKRLTVEKEFPAGLHDFVNAMKQQYTVDMIHSHCRPRFNHEYALSRLKSEGYRLALASNSVRATIDLMMEKSCLAPYFDFTLSNQDVVRAKPDPEIYRKATQRFGLAPEECLVVEDNENGVKAAFASGCHLLAVKTVDEVSYPNIRRRIDEIDHAAKEVCR